ncbi:MAG TPA: MBL fold metallo-hydrolase [Candidatus Limnocylindria bacterium]|nr:MBL fold metallo-hydrolase [Candidatus Limnocylindria bacterium]
MADSDATVDTRIDEVGDGIYRISTATAAIPGGFTFNQYLLVDDEPLLYHTGMRGLFPAVRRAIESVLPLARLRWIAFAHVEADECGAFRELLDAAPAARPLCGRTQAMLAIGDLTDRPATVLADGAVHATGRRRLLWMDAPHVPHGWDNAFAFETTTRTLFCGDLFTQGGAALAPVTESDVLGPSEALRAKLPYFALGPNTAAVLDRLAATEPVLLACMHGSAWRGDGAALLRALRDRLP